jgi:Fe-S cluster biosynthesis and repair protein YggX
LVKKRRDSLIEQLLFGESRDKSTNIIDLRNGPLVPGSPEDIENTVYTEKAWNRWANQTVDVYEGKLKKFDLKYKTGLSQNVKLYRGNPKGPIRSVKTRTKRKDAIVLDTILTQMANQGSKI